MKYTPFVLFIIVLALIYQLERRHKRMMFNAWVEINSLKMAGADYDVYDFPI